MNEAISQVEVVRQEVMPIPDQAKMIVVRDQGTLVKANDFFLTIKALRKKISETFDPIITKANAAHKEALNQKALIEAPLIVAEKYLNGQVKNYKVAQDLLRRAEEEKLRQEAIKAEMERRHKEEEEKIAQATALAEAGALEEADALIEEAVEEAIKPIEVIIAPPETPKVKLMGAAMRESWDFEIEKESLIPRQYLIPNLKKIGGIVRVLKGETNIPGIKVFRVDKMVATGK
jgi:hypothetical protein